MSGQSSAPASRRTKVAALVAGGALVVGGVGYTLASWTDTEWVFGGNGNGGPGVGTSTFEVEQNVTGLPAGWTQAETDPGQEMTFTADAIALSPGDATYAGVTLRTVAGSVAGNVEVQPAVRAAGVAAVDAGDLLWDALQVRVAATAAGVPCDAAAFTATTIVRDRTARDRRSGGSAGARRGRRVRAGVLLRGRPARRSGAARGRGRRRPPGSDCRTGLGVRGRVGMTDAVVTDVGRTPVGVDPPSGRRSVLHRVRAVVVAVAGLVGVLCVGWWAVAATTGSRSWS